MRWPLGALAPLTMPLLAFTTPVLGLLAYSGIPYLILAGAALALAADPAAPLKGLKRGPRVAALAVGFIALGAARAPFAPEAAKAAQMVTFQTLLAGAWVVLNGAPRPTRATAWALVAGIGVASATILIDTAFGHGPATRYAALIGETFTPSAFNRALTILVLLTFVQLGAVTVPLAVRLLATAAVAAAVFLGEGAAAMAALVLGGVAAGLTAHLGKRVIECLAVLAAALILAMPALVRTVPVDDAAFMARFPPGNTQARLHIWDYTARRALERPLLGWGPDAGQHFSELPKLDRPLIREGESISWVARPIPSHPHNGPLQLWLEYGLVGVLFAVALVGLAFGEARRRAVPGPALASGLVVAALTVTSTAYGLWQMNWPSAMTIAALLGAGRGAHGFWAR